MGFNIFECAHSRFVIHNMGHYLYFDICGWPHNNRQWWNSPSHCCYLSFKNIFSQVPWFIALFLGHWSTQRCWWDELFLSQSKHIQEILDDTQVQYCKGIQSPMSTSETLLVDDGASKTDGNANKSVLGKLYYLWFTRPDITYSVNKLTQFNTSLFVIH